METLKHRLVILRKQVHDKSRYPTVTRKRLPHLLPSLDNMEVK